MQANADARRKEFDQQAADARQESDNMMARQRAAGQKADQERQQLAQDALDRANESREQIRNQVASNIASSSNHSRPSSNSSYTPNTPQYESVFVCSECDGELPSHIGAGDRCPHCKVHLSYEEDEYGNVTHDPATLGGNVARVVILGLCLLFGGVGAMKRKLFG